VQECEHNNNNNNNNISADKSNKEEVTTAAIPSNEDDANDDDDDVKISTMNQLNLVTKGTSDGGIQNATNELKASKNQNNNKAKGFSARFLQNFKRSHHNNNNNNHETGKTSHHKSNRNSMPDVPLLKLSGGKVSASNHAQMPSDGSDRSKKIKILGRYFQVSKAFLGAFLIEKLISSTLTGSQENLSAPQRSLSKLGQCESLQSPILFLHRT
jgi:hypothetical protein